MKIIRFDRGSGAEIGFVHEGGIVPLPASVPINPGAMCELIEQWDSYSDIVQAAVAASRPEDRIMIDDVRLLCPVDVPQKILALGLNYADHVAEAKLEIPTDQVWFCKQRNVLAGPRDTIEIPKASDSVDYEVELVVIIGKRGRHISKENAPDAVFGYCVGNDVSVREWQLATPQWMLGKSFDTHGPLGPWIVTADEIGDPHRLDITCSVNGERRQNSNTRHLVFSVWDQITHLSQAMTLEPGDVLFTGTPGGVGWAANPRKNLRPGDVVRCEIEDIGFIENSFVDER